MACIEGMILKMHVYGHWEDCQVFWSYSYLPCLGMTYGEGIESAWAEQNHTVGSTHEQNEGHWHDMLDDFNGYWNWTKVHSMSTFGYSCAKHHLIPICIGKMLGT
jgi:hypothetical protein